MIPHALAYAQRLGWRVFLVSDDCRVPIKHGNDGEPGAWPHGVKDATSDSDELRRRLTLYPRANLALACGPESNILALDVDAKVSGTAEVDGFGQLAALEAEHSPLPPTWRARTPSGGAHILFAYPGPPHPANRAPMTLYRRDGSRTKFPGLDVRGKGASIALAPSRKPTGNYSWEVKPLSVPLAPCPAWLLDIMRSEPPPPPERKPMRLEHYDRAARYAAVVVENVCGTVASTKSGRNQELFKAACTLGSLVGGNIMGQTDAEAALERAAADCGLWRDDGPHSVRGTIRSGIRRGLQKPRELTP